MNRDTRLVALGLLLWGFGEGLFLHIQPLYIEQLGADPVQIGGLISAAGIVRAASFLPAGVLADRVPRKWVMVGGWVTGLIGVLLVGLARSWQGLVPGLLVYALSAYCIPVINAYLAHAAGGRQLTRVFTTVFAGYAAGSVISPAVGGWLAEVAKMRTVYFAAAAIFGLSMLVVARVAPQPVEGPSQPGRRWQALFNRRFLRFAAFVCVLFLAMYVGFPLTPNFLSDVGGWRVARIGMLGSFQALGTALLNPFLGRLSDGGSPRGRGDGFRDDALAQTEEVRSSLGRVGGLLVGQGLVWVSALLLLLTGTFPFLVAAYVLRGAYQGCRSLIQAQATTLAREGDRGLVLGATETVIAAAQVFAPYAAGLLYTGDATWPLVGSLVLIPITLILTFRG